MWTQIRLLLYEQSDLGPHCLFMRLQNVSVDNKNLRIFVICALRVNTCAVSDIRLGFS